VLCHRINRVLPMALSDRQQAIVIAVWTQFMPAKQKSALIAS
jgi:hypothetical protein